MHGFLWTWHKDHHQKDHGSWFERNDRFFIFFAALSTSLLVLGGETSFWYGCPMGFGILAYGIAYVAAHDIFIHQRCRLLKNANNRYARGIRRAHKVHHKHLGKEDGECFGMLLVPFKYFRK